jgi:hypothetical protein
MECLFCQNLADSNEDMFPRWILKTLKTKELTFRQIGTKPPRITKSPRVKIKSVCQQCNNRWMSNLENQSKPTIEKMLENIPSSLTTSQQTLLSQWAVKTAIILDSVESHVRFYLKDECEKFKASKDIPRETAVWLGRFTERRHSAFGSSFSVYQNDVAPISHGCVATILVGHLIFHILTIRTSPTYVKPIRIADGLARRDELLIRVWPAQTNDINWPPPHSFSLSGEFPYRDLLTRWKQNLRS